MPGLACHFGRNGRCPADFAGRPSFTVFGPSTGEGPKTMNEEHLLPFQRLDIYVAAKELARRTHEARIRDSELRDQATRAAKSAFLGVCEGLPSDAGGVRRRHFDIANNSLHELVGAVDLAEAIAAVDAGVAKELLALAVRVKRMLRRLPR